MPSGANSQSESLGASISDLSSEAASEFSDNYIVNNTSNGHIQFLSTKSNNSNNQNGTGTSTPNKNSSLNNSNTSKLPIYKKSNKQ
jgi:hypothetical protein